AALGKVELRWSLHRLLADDRWIIGVDEPGVAVAFGVMKPSRGDLVIVPRSFGAEVSSGAMSLDVPADAVAAGPMIPATTSADEVCGHLLRLELVTAGAAVE